MLAREACRKPPVTVPAGATIADAARLMDRRSVGALVVVDDEERPIGIVTDRDLAVRGLGHQLPGATSVSPIMSHELVTLCADD